MSATASNTRPLHVARTGDRGGVPVVFVHPVAMDHGYWDGQVEALRDRRDVVTYDQPGHGRSPGGPDDCTLAQAGETLARVIRSIGPGPAHVVGLSVGGMIAQTAALAHPQLVASLTLMGTAATFTPPVRALIRARAGAVRDGGMQAIRQATLERWFAPATIARRPELVERVMRTLMAHDPAVDAAMWEMVATLDLADALPRIACPTLVLVGELDPSTPPADSRLIAERIPGATLHTVPGVSHMLPLEAPAEVNERLVAFLETLA